MKTCTICGELRPMERFSKHPGMRDGRVNQCYDCKNAKKRAKSTYSARRYTPEEDQIIRDEYPHVHTEIIAKKLGRSLQSVLTRAWRLGCEKSAEYMEGAMQRFIESTSETRFKKGNVPWSAGKKIGTRGRSGETQFKKGHRPHNWVPVGTVRKTHDGYWQKKMTDTGYPPKDWVMISHLIWEELNGPLPDGYVIKYKDENTDNLSPENLLAMSREDATRMQVSMMDPGIKKIHQLLAVISRQLNKRGIANGQ